MNENEARACAEQPTDDGGPVVNLDTNLWPIVAGVLVFTATVLRFLADVL